MINKINLDIWGRQFELPVEFDCFKDEKVTEEQVNAIKTFESHADWIANSRIKAELFCKKAVQEDPSNSKKDNIFSYLKPDYVYVKRDDKSSPKVALMCKYRYDIEHGIALVFAHDGSIVVGLQDIIL